MKSQKMKTRYLVLVAMFSAVSYVLVIISKVIPNVAGFLSYEPKDAIIVIAGFFLGPMASFFISLIVSFIEMLTISTTGPYGLLMNVVSTCAFAVPAAFIYKKMHSRKGALIGLITGVAAMAVCMLIWNYTITPFYMGVDRSVVAGMLMSIFLPFNLIKGGLNAAIAMILYKPLVTALRKTKLVEQNAPAGKGTFSVGFFLALLAVIITLVFLFLALAGVI